MPAPTGTGLPARVTTLTATSGNTYYVDPSIGSDSNTATQAKNPATPWATVQKALNSGVPIPTAGSNTPIQIYIRGTDGTTTRGFTITDTGPGSACPAGFQATAVYQPSRTLNFPVDSPLLISNYPGERVLIGFPFLISANFSYVCWKASNVSGKKGLVFDTRFPAGNLTFAGFAGHGGSHIELFNCEVRNNTWNAAGGGIYIGGYDFSGTTQRAIDYQIINCYIHHNGGATQGAHGMYFGGTTGAAKGALNGAIYNNLVIFNTDDNIDPHNTCDGTVICNNLAAGWGGGGTGSGVSSTPLTGTGKTYGWTTGINFFSNVPTDPASTNMVIANNLLTNNLVYGLRDYDSALGSSNEEKNNLYFGNGTGNRSATAGMILSSTLLNNDPQYTSFSSTNPASDFHPLGTSPAINAADPAYCPLFDFDGATRTNSDIGPYAIGGGGGGGGGVGAGLRRTLLNVG